MMAGPGPPRARARWWALVLPLALALNAGGADSDTLVGTVRDSSGAPVNNVDFDFFDIDGNKLLFDGSTRTTGRYSIQVDPGRYDVVCQPPITSGLASQVRRGVAVNGATQLDWVVPPSVQARGRVLGPGGQPVASAKLDFDRVDDGSRQPVQGNVTSLFGTFVAYLAAGDYRVTAFPDTADSALAPSRLSFVHLPTSEIMLLTLVPAVHLIGAVRDPEGAPVARAKFLFESADSGVRVPASGHYTGADGTFRAGVAPGTYRVVVQPPRGRLVSVRLGPLDLSRDSSVDVNLPSGFVLSGRVFDRSYRPVVGADWDAADEATETSVPTPDDNTDYDGRYSFALPTGIYRLTLRPPPGSGLDTLVLRNVRLMRDTVLNVSYGGSAGGNPGLSLAPLNSPTRRTADLRLVLLDEGQVRIEVFDVTGRSVRTLVDEWMAAGVHDLHWAGDRRNGAPAHAGIYFVRAIQSQRTAFTRFVVLP
jgi:hypothetical protein